MISFTGLMTAMIFLKPMVYDSSRLWMLLPLTLAVSIVYKTARVRDIRAVPFAAFMLWVTILGGMLAVAVALYVLMYLFL